MQQVFELLGRREGREERLEWIAMVLTIELALQLIVYMNSLAA